MRILDPTPEEGVERKHTCTACGARLAYLKADVQEKPQTYDYLGDPNDIRYFVVCGNCKDEQYVKKWS